MPGREAVTLRISLDDYYVAHLPLLRRGRADYRVMLGPAAAGRHIARVEIDAELTAAGLRADTAARIEDVQVVPLSPDEPDHTALALAPYLYARPNTIARFTDVPAFMWYERDATA